MSCRILKRGMEEFIINKIIHLAKEHGYNTVIGEYIQTKKNFMVENIYIDLGFSHKNDNFFIADVNNFDYNKTFVKEHMNESR